MALARHDCPCFEGEAPEDYNATSTGLYLTDLTPLDGLQGFNDCSEGGAWSLLSRCREQGVLDFLGYTSGLMMQHNRFLRQPYNGPIGRFTARQASPVAAAYAGLRIWCGPIRSGVLKITEIGAAFKTAGEISVQIYDQFNQTVGSAISITTVAGRVVKKAVSISLPLHGPFGPYTYYMAYDTKGVTPLRTAVTCGCKGTTHLYDGLFTRKKTGSDAWLNWVQVAGWSGDDVESFDVETLNPSGVEDCSNGLILNTSITCDPTSVLCASEADLNSPLTLSIAHAIRYAAGVRVADAILASSDLNRYALINRETLRDARKDWLARYAENVRFIAENANASGNDCICPSGFVQMKTGAILA